MSLVTAGLWISCVWLIIHGVKYSSRRSKPLLPFSHGRRPTTEVTVKNFNLRLKTQAFNELHETLCSRFSSNDCRLLKLMLVWLYDLGSIVSIAGMLTALGLLLWTTVALSRSVFQTQSTYVRSATILAKRGLEYVDNAIPSIAPANDALAVNPIIPGVTVPLSHLPLIILALCVSQIVHEAGHAITAALHRIPMLSSGVSVTLILPAAFVVLPSARLEELLPRDRLRVVAGGCFHNFAFWCLLFLAAWSGFGPVFASLLFQDVSSSGKVIAGIDYDSPLMAHIPVGALITQLDDVQMGSVGLAVKGNPWDDYLLGPSSAPSRGWCVDSFFLSNVTKCISIGLQSCFVSKEDPSVQYSLDPVPIFTGSTSRCGSQTECAPVASCVVPRSDQQLLRIALVLDLTDGEGEEVIVWKGPKREIWQQVEVSNLRPRFPFISIRLPNVASNFFEYLKMTNLSLYIVNMLPLPALDGSQLLIVLLELLFSRTSGGPGSIDLEGLGDRRRPSQGSRAQRACRAFLSMSTVVLVSLCALLSVVKWMKN
ncbi:hypothetical protein HYDPIDRAFT_98042 [Hydnomerulius pinastri MD-312]|uniref:Endopeptidase S2P n=1 Tax=Hydnomerulius pinastri MD-312 TaxID=994086 RepID=A0A0C9V5F4_9AGAM|nr:hypothetical protein HYDPIDRAFT_98042 [Hydnomerulius pinastri MD-312]